MEQPVLELGSLHLDMLGELEAALERAAGNAKRQVGPREDAETSTIAEKSATLRKAG